MLGFAQMRIFLNKPEDPGRNSDGSQKLESSSHEERSGAVRSVFLKFCALK